MHGGIDPSECKKVAIVYGAEAKVLEPENLRKDIIAELAATREQYT
jgi:predicted DNA-binding transcriptional regulator YafY